MSEAPAEGPMRWVKSTRSAANGNCVEVAETVAGVAVRDSKDPDGPVLRFSADAWRGFVEGVQQGTFDRPGVS